MKKLTLLLFLLYFSTIAVCQTETLCFGHMDTVTSLILNEARPFLIYVPDGASNEKSTRYPVVYLLDGDWHFSMVVGMLQQLSTVNGNTICPEMIVVGIPNTDRYRDLTPSHDAIFSPTTGGNEAFIAFLEKELIPAINSRYPVAPYRILMGHSLAGLTTMNTLVNHTGMFNAYVAIDPSMWWDRQSPLKSTHKALEEKRFDNTRLFLAIANNLPQGIDTSNIKSDTTPLTLNTRSALALANDLSNNKMNGLNTKIKYYETENHASVPLIAVYDALHFLFDFFPLKLSKKDYLEGGIGLPERISKHYENVSEKMGYKVNPSENTINTLGYNALMMKNYPQAELFFKMNLINYPTSFNVYDSYGDYFVAVDDKPNAIKMFTQSLSLFENQDTRKKLMELIPIDNPTQKPNDK